MRFETKPRLILTENEYNTLAGAMALCQDMDVATSFDEDENECVVGCQKCPLKENCNHLTKDCVYVVAHEALKKIIDMSIVK